jgi:hypothetical protein
MTILAVECAAGRRFVEVLKPVGAHQVATIAPAASLITCTLTNDSCEAK